MKESTIKTANELMEKRDKLRKFREEILKRNESLDANEGKAFIRFASAYRRDTTVCTDTFSNSQVPEQLSSQVQQIMEEAFTKIEALACTAAVKAEVELRNYNGE